MEAIRSLTDPTTPITLRVASDYKPDPYTLGEIDAMYGRPHCPPEGCTAAEHAEYIEGSIAGERTRLGWERRLAARLDGPDYAFDSTDFDWIDKQPLLGR